jgi:integrase
MSLTRCRDAHPSAVAATHPHGKPNDHLVRREQASGCDTYILVLVLGLRLKEALGLRWEDLDLDRSEMTIG